MSKNYTMDRIELEVKNFVAEKGYFPTSTDLEHNCKSLGLPSRKTITNAYGSINNLLQKCGLLDLEKSNLKIGDCGRLVTKFSEKDELDALIDKYVFEYGEIPTIKEINIYAGVEIKKYATDHYGSWNNLLKQKFGVLNSVSQYTDKELYTAFNDFVIKYNRVPSIRDFNATGRPSFWVYQNRFGSWAKACMHYGYKPKCRESEYYMDDGERCDSTYEFDISTWLKQQNINYLRDVKYKDFIDNYSGKMNCDYVINSNENIWYVEMAGFIPSFNYTKLKQRPEQLYYFKLRYKEKLLRRQGCKYKILFPSDLKNQDMKDVFDFLWP